MARKRCETDGIFPPNVSRFIDEYIACYGNGTLAYMRAYETTNQKTAKAESHQLLKREDIQNEIAARSRPFRQSLQDEAETIRARLISMIDGTDASASNADACRAADILNRMSARYINRVSDESTEKNAVQNMTHEELMSIISEKP